MIFLKHRTRILQVLMQSLDIAAGMGVCHE